MSWKKNGFSYFIWLIYALMTGTALICLFSGMENRMTTGILCTALAFALVGILVFLLHRFGPKYSEKRNEKHTVRNVMEAAIAVVLLAVGLVFRIRGLNEAGQTAAYFEMAQITSGQSIPQIAHGAVYFYVQILHTVFYFLGNKFIAGIGFQIILQYGAVLMLYYSMRHLSGHIAALVTLAFVMCSPYMVQSTLMLSPEMFYLIFFMAAMTWVVSGHMVKLRPSEFLFLGAMIAVLSYMDIAGLLLFFLSIAVILDTRKEQPGWRKKLSAMLLCIFGLLIGFTACVYTDAYISGKSANGVWAAWKALYHPKGFRLPVTYADSDSVTECIVLFGLLAFGVFSFWRDRKSDYMKAYTIGICIVLAASSYGIFTEEMPGTLWLFLILSILAGISVEECFRKLPKTVEKPIEIEKSKAVEMKKEAVLKREEPTPQHTCNYIENPLPLPKKHEKRILDYDVMEEKMEDDFDLEIAEDDDFDI